MPVSCIEGNLDPTVHYSQNTLISVFGGDKHKSTIQEDLLSDDEQVTNYLLLFIYC